MRQHNGTVYRWNRPCYGVKDGAPHLRIENRALPETPTPDAVETMRRHGVSCLPVVHGTKLVGILTERDLIAVTAELLDQPLREFYEP